MPERSAALGLARRELFVRVQLAIARDLIAGLFSGFIRGAAVDSNEPALVASAGPSAPKLTAKDLLRQFWADAYGKEVQTAATYSYTWLADQFGHICIGILADFLATLVSGLVIVRLGWQSPLEYDTGIWPGFALAVFGACLWEWSAYRSAIKQATGAFPLDTKLLRDNAVIAATYISLGALLGFAFHSYLVPSLLISAVVVVAAIVLAPPWLRQKIIWQKASIPYLFRLADAAPTIKDDDAKVLMDLIEAGAPPNTPPHQIVIGGPIGSGRTSMAAGIGTEFAFKQNKVRYLGLDCLLEFAANATEHSFPDDSGPKTISYWPWSQAQVVIIDGVGPLLAADEPNREANLDRFKRLLQKDLGLIAAVLRRCHTVWVWGDLRPTPASERMADVLDEFAEAVAEYCNSPHDAFVIELGPRTVRPVPPSAKADAMRTAPLATNVRGVRRVSKKP
jgi:hypothetical protein